MVVRHLVVVLILLVVPSTRPAAATTSDDVDKEVAHWQDEIGKARHDFQTEVEKADDRAVKTLSALAKRQVKVGDLAGASAAWKAVLAVDVNVAEARDFFTAHGRLDEVLDEVAAHGDPLAAEGDRHALVFSPGGVIWPSGNALSAPFTRRTIELSIGKATGDGVLYDEGNERTGVAITLIGSEVRFIIGINGVIAELKGEFDRGASWTHLAAQFADGEVSLWIGGKLAQRARMTVDAMPERRGESGIGCERRGSVAALPKTTLSFRLAMFRLSNVARFATAFTPPRDAVTDATTVLAIGSANLGEALATAPTPKADDGLKDATKDKQPTGLKIRAFANLPDGNITWTVNGDVVVR